MLDFNLVGCWQNIALAPYNLVMALINPGRVAELEQSPEAVMRFIYYGASVEFFFVILTTFIVITRGRHDLEPRDPVVGRARPGRLRQRHRPPRRMGRGC